MRTIAENEKPKQLTHVSLFLTREEALHLIELLWDMVAASPGPDSHQHFWDEEFMDPTSGAHHAAREITLSWYERGHPSNHEFHPAIKKVIEDDKGELIDIQY